MVLQKMENNQKVFCGVNFNELKNLVNKKTYRILATIEKLGYKNKFIRFLEEYVSMEFYEYENCGELPTIEWYNNNIRNQWECYKENYIK